MTAEAEELLDKLIKRIFKYLDYDNPKEVSEDDFNKDCLNLINQFKSGVERDIMEHLYLIAEKEAYIEERLLELNHESNT